MRHAMNSIINDYLKSSELLKTIKMKKLYIGDITVVNIENDATIINNLVSTLNNYILDEMLYLVKSEHTETGIINISPIRLNPNRYVWLNVTSTVTLASGIQSTTQLIVYPTGSLVSDVTEYATRTMLLTYAIITKFAKEEKEEKIPGLSTEVKTDEVNITVPLLVSILLTRFYNEEDKDLLSVAVMILCEIYNISL